MNILDSFGWQHISIGIVSKCELTNDFSKSKYIVEIEMEIPQMKQMKSLEFSSYFKTCNCTGKVIIYNPDKWKCVELYFFEEFPNVVPSSKVYRLLHLSM